MLEQAAATFPLNSDFRAGPAVFYSATRWPGSASPAIAALRSILVIDPNAADMRRNLVGFLYETRDPGLMLAIVGLRRLVPDRKIALFVSVEVSP
jgi:hypothetical protein